MKTNKHLVSVIAILGFAIISNAQVPNYVSSNGLVGWWPFNGNANDESGNGNNGTVNGATLTNDRFGNANKSFDFDFTHWSWGSGGDEIFIPFNSSFNSSNISVSAWVKRESQGYPGQSQCIITRYQFGYSNPNGQVWGISGGYEPNFLVEYGVIEASTNNNQTVISNSGDTLQLNIWTHVVLTFDGNNARLYENGNLGSITSSNGLVINTLGNSGISIGLSDQANGHWAPFDGNIDDIGIWNRALTDCEIQDLYHSQLGSQAISAGLDQSICAGDNVTLSASGGNSYQWNNNVLDGLPFTPTQTATYAVNGTDSLGCQGSDTVMITVLDNGASSLTQTALDSYTLNGQTYTQSGTYTQVVPAANGCDSTITLNLTLNFTGIHDLGTATKILVKITDLNGKIIQRRKNTVMLFIYEDGTVERVVEME